MLFEAEIWPDVKVVGKVLPGEYEEMDFPSAMEICGQRRLVHRRKSLRCLPKISQH